MIFAPKTLNAYISSEFAESLDLHFQQVGPELFLVAALTLNFGLNVSEQYLKDAFEKLKAQGRDVLVVKRNHEHPQLDGQLVLMEEIRCAEDVTKALAFISASSKVVATIHGSDSAAAIKRLNKLAGQRVQIRVAVVSYQGQHELVHPGV